jgi:outer membrane protein insertion porin family
VRALVVAGAVVGLLLPAWRTAGQLADQAPVEGVRIDRVIIAGNQRVEDEAIRVKLKAAPGASYSDQLVDDDVRAIYRMGFFDDVRATADRQDGQWVLTYDVHERPYVRAVKIEGNKKIDKEELEGMLRIRPNTILDPEKARKGIEEAKSAYEKKGYLDADIRYETAPVGENEVDLTFLIDEREPIRIAAIEFEGNKKIEKEELEGMLRIRPNTILDPEKARLGIQEATNAYEKKGYLDVDIHYETAPVGENEVDVTFIVDEHDAIRIRDIVIEGNTEFSDSELKNVMATKERWILSFITGAGNLDREVLNTDAERLTAFYYENGFIDVRVDEPKIERDEDGLTVTFKIDEGQRYTFGDVSIVGETLPDVAPESNQLNAQKGETFQPSKLREDINGISAVYGDIGYAFVNVTPETDINPADKVVNVSYRVTRGPEVFIDRIEISGNTKTRDKVIRRELELQEQRRFSGSKLRRSQTKLQRLGYFEDVNITTRKAEAEDRLDLVVDVREASTGAFSAGAGLSSGESFLFNVRMSELNKFGRGQRLVLNADFGSIRRNLSLSFTEPYFLDSYLTLGLDVFNWQLQFDEFTRGGTGGSVRTLYPFSALGWNELWGVSLLDTRFGLDYRIEQAEISDVSRGAASVIRAEQGTSLTSSITPRLYRDTRNHPFDPTEGSLQDLSLEIAGIGGSSHFIKAETRLRFYQPIWKSQRFGTFTFSIGGNFGYGFGYQGERELPLFERYFPGGIKSVRGYSVRSLGPQVPVFGQGVEDNDHCDLSSPDRCADLLRRDAVGGSQELVFNNEIIFPIVQSLGLKGVIFFDAGQAFSAAKGIQMSEMRTAAGFGFRWLSPIGPLRIEIGFPLNPRVGDDTQTVLFSFGGPP